MDEEVTTFASGNKDLGSPQQLGGSVPALFLGCMCLFGICTNAIILCRVILTYIKAKEDIHTADAYLFQKAAFDLLLLLGSPFYVISVWNGHEVSLFSWQCRILVSVEFLAILLTNHVIIAIVFERYGRRTINNGKPIIMTTRDADRHFQANFLYSLMLGVGIVFVADEVIWREVSSCGYNWPAGQNYHAMVFILLFAIVYCISYFIFVLWGIDLFKLKFSRSPRAIQQQRRLPISAEDSRRDKAALLTLLIHFCCWTPFWCYHLYLVKHYYRVRPTIHLPGGFHTDELFVSSLMYLSASTNIFPSAMFIKEWAPRRWFIPLNSPRQSNVSFFQGNSRVADLRVEDFHVQGTDPQSTGQNKRTGIENHLTTVSGEMLDLSNTAIRGQRSDQTIVAKSSYTMPSTSC